MRCILFSLLVLLAPAPAGAFSKSFKEQMTSVQEKVMLRGMKFTEAEARKCWERFDEEIVSLLSKKATEKRLNKETAAEELTFIDRKDGEEEYIELGTIEAGFLRLDLEGKVWLAALQNRMGDLLSSTFHIFQKKDGHYVRTAALEEVAGPWNRGDRGKILWTAIQIQPIVSIRPSPQQPFTPFISYHLPSFKKSKNNRSQIVWEFDGSSLKADFWIPEVDWHEVEGQTVPGRGEIVPVPR